MKSYDLVITKEIVRLLKEEGLDVVDNQFISKGAIVVIADSREVEDKTKTFDRNLIEYKLTIWGSKNGSNVEIKELKSKVFKALTEGEYRLDGYVIDNVDLMEAYTFKEVEVGGNTHYFQSSINISYKIKEAL